MTSFIHLTNAPNTRQYLIISALYKVRRWYVDKNYNIWKNEISIKQK